MNVRNVSLNSTWLRLIGGSIAAALAVLIALHVSRHRNQPAAKVGVNPPPMQTLHVPELTITKIVQHGHIVEIAARVEPGATVMVNGERAALIWEDGEIKHFVGPLPDGVSDIAITVQTNDGGINSKQLSVVLP